MNSISYKSIVILPKSNIMNLLLHEIILSLFTFGIGLVGIVISMIIIYGRVVLEICCRFWYGNDKHTIYFTILYTTML